MINRSLHGIFHIDLGIIPQPIWYDGLGMKWRLKWNIPCNKPHLSHMCRHNFSPNLNLKVNIRGDLHLILKKVLTHCHYHWYWLIFEVCSTVYHFVLLFSLFWILCYRLVFIKRLILINSYSWLIYEKKLMFTNRFYVLDQLVLVKPWPLLTN